MSAEDWMLAGDGVFAVPGSPWPSLRSLSSKDRTDGLGAVPSVLDKYRTDGTVENTACSKPENTLVSLSTPRSLH